MTCFRPVNFDETSKRCKANIGREPGDSPRDCASCIRNLAVVATVSLGFHVRHPCNLNNRTDPLSSQTRFGKASILFIADAHIIDLLAFKNWLNVAL